MKSHSEELAHNRDCEYETNAEGKSVADLYEKVHLVLLDLFICPFNMFIR